MIENVSLWENPFFFIFFFGLMIGIALWLVNWFEILSSRRCLSDIRKYKKEIHDADYSPLNKLLLVEVEK